MTPKPTIEPGDTVEFTVPVFGPPLSPAPAQERLVRAQVVRVRANEYPAYAVVRYMSGNQEMVFLGRLTKVTPPAVRRGVR